MKIIKMLCAFFLVLPMVGCFSAGDNFAECVIKNIPEVKNESARLAVNKQCFEAHPEGMNAIAQGNNLGLMAKYKSQQECILGENKLTSLQAAAIQVNRACYCLYTEPNHEGQKCA